MERLYLSPFRKLIELCLSLSPRTRALGKVAQCVHCTKARVFRGYKVWWISTSLGLGSAPALCCLKQKEILFFF